MGQATHQQTDGLFSRPSSIMYCSSRASIARIVTDDHLSLPYKPLVTWFFIATMATTRTFVQQAGRQNSKGACGMVDTTRQTQKVHDR